MSVTVHVPGSLRAYRGGTAAELELSAANVHDALTELERLDPAVYRGVCDETGAVRQHVNLFVNTSHVRELDGLETPLAPGDALVILPAVSGG